MPFRSRLSLSSAITNSSTQHGPSSKPDDMDPRTPYPDEEDDEGLPRPVQASKYPGTPMRKKKTRLSLGAYFRWDKFLRKLGSGTAPSTSSAPDESSGESTGYNRSRVATRAVGEDDEVNEVVVDREWSGEIKSSVHSGDHGGPEKSGSNPQMGYGGTSTDRDSVAIPADGFWTSNMGLIYLRYRIWPAVYGFFCTHFMDEKSENHYKKENWFLRKSLAIWSAAFWVINWVLAVSFIPHPADLSDKIFYYGWTPALTFPLFFMVVYDFPRDRPIFYQTFLLLSTWSWSCYQLLFMFLCGFYDSSMSRFDCRGKDFLSTFYYTSALQTIALFGLGFNRFPAVMGVAVFMGMAFTVPENLYAVTGARLANAPLASLANVPRRRQDCHEPSGDVADAEKRV